MQSESARVTTAAEARYRVDAPNSLPRNVKVIALGPQSDAVVQRLSGLRWARAQFLTASSFTTDIGDRTEFRIGSWLNDLAGQAKSLVDEVAGADLVVMYRRRRRSGRRRRDDRRCLPRAPCDWRPGWC